MQISTNVLLLTPSVMYRVSRSAEWTVDMHRGARVHQDDAYGGQVRLERADASFVIAPLIGEHGVIDRQKQKNEDHSSSQSTV